MRSSSRRVTLTTALVVWFAPPLLLLHQLVSNGVHLQQALGLLPLMNGWALVRFFAIKSPWSPEVLLLSAIIPGVLVVGLVLSSYRKTLLITGTAVSCALTACAYCLLIA